jgi:hypothetical protein
MCEEFPAWTEIKKVLLMKEKTEHQQELAKQIDADFSNADWGDWKWQMKHRITASLSEP